MRTGVRARIRELIQDRPLQVMTAAAFVVATAAVAAPVREAREGGRESLLTTAIERATAAVSSPDRAPLQRVWEGADLDGDGRADFANPTGQAPRAHDAYGEGEFGASRDGGVRRHAGVDFMADAGQDVVAPISGYVTKIGFAYGSDQNLKFVEITNPALKLAARVFYINPKVEVGDTVAVGHTIGAAHSLQRRYPGGMTDHVHLEVIDARGDRIDATLVINEKYAAAD